MTLGNDPKLHRTNINLYQEDIDWFKHIHGWGWTERIRDIIHRYVAKKKAEAIHYGKTRTREEFMKDFLNE